MMAFLVIVIFSSIVVGILGRNFRFGFWGYFFASVLMTPIVGLLLVIASIPPKGEKQKA